MPNSYATPAAFRQALEARLIDLAHHRGVDIQRLRKQVAFDRLLCRLFQLPGNPLVLKGGYAMELCLAENRTTRDIDLVARDTLPGPGRVQARILRLLQAGATLDLQDFFCLFHRPAFTQFRGRALRRRTLSGRGSHGRANFCQVSFGCGFRRSCFGAFAIGSWW